MFQLLAKIDFTNFLKELNMEGRGDKGKVKHPRSRKQNLCKVEMRDVVLNGVPASNFT